MQPDVRVQSPGQIPPQFSVPETRTSLLGPWESLPGTRYVRTWGQRTAALEPPLPIVRLPMRQEQGGWRPLGKQEPFSVLNRRVKGQGRQAQPRQHPP